MRYRRNILYDISIFEGSSTNEMKSRDNSEKNVVIMSNFDVKLY